MILKGELTPTRAFALKFRDAGERNSMKYIVEEVVFKANDEAIRVSHPDSWNQKGGAGFGDLRRRYVQWDPSTRNWWTIPEGSLVVFTKDDKRQFRFFRVCFQQARKEAAEKKVSLWGTLKDYFELKKVLPL